jgi:hypothetical protein
MALNHSPSVTTANLLLNLDFKNQKRFSSSLGTGNLVQNFNYNASNWVNIFPDHATLTPGIDAPDGSRTAVRLSCRTTGSSLLRVSFTLFTPNGTDLYATSFWVRLVSGTTPSTLTTDLHDGNPTANYLPLLSVGKWVRVVTTGIPTAAGKTFIDLLSNNTNDYVLDFWGIKIENLTAANNPYPLVDTVGSFTFNNFRPQFSTINEDFITFDRTTAPKHGGLAFATGTGALTSQNFLYNDFTWEVWFRINDRNPENSANESWSALALYRGWHSGFFYTATSMRFNMVDNTGPTQVIACSWTVGASGAQINQGSWYQIVVTRNGNVFTPYINGVNVGTGSTRAYTAFPSVSNDLQIGAAANVAAGVGDFIYYSKSSIANMKMYNRALSASEVMQNFQALRGRFGI